MHRDITWGLWLTGALLFVWPATAAPTCPAGQRPTLSGCRSTTESLHLTAPEAARPSEPRTKPGAAPDATLRPDPSLLERADRRLLTEEIARLEHLVSGLPKKAPDRARIVLRLGDSYAELAKLAEREYIERDRETEAAARAAVHSPPKATPPVASPSPPRP